VDKPRDVATAATVEFVSEFVPKSAAILEIGCGDGDVAAALQILGYAVTGIDADRDAVETTRAKGVAAIAGEWPTVTASKADVVLFTQSLHHINDLRGAVEATHNMLHGPHLLLVEDFDFHSADEPTIRWLAEKIREASANSFLRNTPMCQRHRQDEFAMSIASALDPMVAWRENHDQDLHPAEAIGNAIAERFSIVRREDAPYLYRYLIPVLENTSHAAEWLRGVLGEERSGEAEEIKLIGRRIVARAT
jgi:SAM-dependent methyltransferase